MWARLQAVLEGKVGNRATVAAICDEDACGVLVHGHEEFLKDPVVPDAAIVIQAWLFMVMGIKAGAWSFFRPLFALTSFS